MGKLETTKELFINCLKRLLFKYSTIKTKLFQTARYNYDILLSILDFYIKLYQPNFVHHNV